MNNLNIVTKEKNLSQVQVLNEFSMDGTAFMSLVHIKDNKKYLAMVLIKFDDIVSYIEQEIPHLIELSAFKYDPFEIINLDAFLPQLADFAELEQLIEDKNIINSTKDIELLKLKQCVIGDNLIALLCDIYYLGNPTTTIMLFRVENNKVINFINVVN